MFGFGSMLKDYLEFYNISQSEFALRLGITQKHMNEILNENADISVELMLAISLITDIDPNLILFAENKKRIYRELNSRFKSEKEIKEYLNSFNIGELNKREWVHFKDYDSIYQKAMDLLNFMNVKNFDTFDKYNEAKILYKKKDNADMIKISLWINRCDILVRSQKVNEYSSKNFVNLLQELKIESNKSFNESAIIKILNKYGIYLIIEDALQGTKIRGCALVKNNNPAIYITKLYKDKSSFYYTLYHELGHIKTDYNKAKSKVIIDSNEESELKADLFAIDTMIPKDVYEEIKNNINSIELISKREKISLSFIVSRLAHDKLIKYNSNLYQKYRENI